PELFTLSLHDALPISTSRRALASRRPPPVASRCCCGSPDAATIASPCNQSRRARSSGSSSEGGSDMRALACLVLAACSFPDPGRSEEHTSELQSRGHL